MTRRLCLLVVAALMWPGLLHAHESRPLNIQISQKASDAFILRWQVPPSVPAGNRPDVTITGTCKADGDGRVSGLQGARLYRCATGLNGSSVEIRYRAYNPSVSALIRVTLTSGEKHTALLSPEETSWPVPQEETTASVAWEYLNLGIRHILTGYDHLLFLVCLLFIARTWRRILVTVTGFTVAHSITLALAALNVIRVPVPPVEAAIALSIVFLAVEIARNRPDTVTMRFPIAVSSTFGLLHGFGFASVLNEIGLPQTEIPAALLFFNLGVEAGQMIFAAGVILLWACLARAAEHLHMVAPLRSRAQSSAVYCVGGLAAFWVVERIAGFWA